MTRKRRVIKEMRRRACLCGLLVVLLCAIPQLAGSAARRVPAGRQLLSLLRRADRQYLDEFTLKCRAVYPYNPRRGFPCRVLRQLTATRSGYSLVTESAFVKQLFPLGDPRGGRKVDTISRDGREYIGLKIEILTLHEPDFVGVLERDDLEVVVEVDWRFPSGPPGHSGSNQGSQDNRAPSGASDGGPRFLQAHQENQRRPRRGGRSATLHR